MLDISNNKKVDSELLERITGEVEKRVLASVGGRSRETEQLLVLLGKVLQQVLLKNNSFTLHNEVVEQCCLLCMLNKRVIFYALLHYR